MNIKEYIQQPVDGLLYDLDLLPEQITSTQSKLNANVITELKKEIQELKQENFVVTGDLVTVKNQIEPIYQAYWKIVGNTIMKNPKLSHVVKIVTRRALKGLG